MPKLESRLRHIAKEYLCTSLPERKPHHNQKRKIHCNSRGAHHTPQLEKSPPNKTREEPAHNNWRGAHLTQQLIPHTN